MFSAKRQADKSKPLNQLSLNLISQKLTNIMLIYLRRQIP